MCSTIIKRLQASSEIAVLYFICIETQPRSKYCHFVLRTLIWQLIRRNHDLAAIVEANYINAGVTPSRSQLQNLMASMISTFPAVRIVVDGLDQCEKADQDKIWDMLSPLAKSANPESTCKILISSQDSAAIPRSLRQRTSVDLSNEVSARLAVEAAITDFVRAEIRKISMFQDDNNHDIDEAEVSKIEQTLLHKADGR